MSSGIFEITHDSLAAKIWEKVSAEEKTLIEVKNFIANSLVMYKSRKVLLTKADLAYIAPYEGKLTLDTETLAFVKRSKRFYRNGRISSIVITAITIAGLIIVIFVIKAANTKAIAKAEEAQLALAKADSSQRLVASGIRVTQLKSDSLIKANGRVNSTLRDLDSTLTELKQQKDQLLTQQALSKLQQMEISANYDKITRQQEDTRQTLENTKQLVENPTMALRQAMDLYDEIGTPELKNYLKKNAFDAYGQVLYTREIAFPYHVLSVAVAYDRKNILIADSTRAPKIWDLTNGTVRSLVGPLNVVTLVAAAAHKPHFVTVEDKKELILWNGDYVYYDTANFRDEIRDIKYINGENELVIGFKNGDIAITDLRGKTQVLIHDDKVAGVEELAVPEQPGHNFFSRSSDDKIRLWTRNELTKKFEDTVIFDDNKLTGKIYSIALSPDGDQLSLGTERGIYCAHASGGKFQQFHFEIYFPSITKITFKSNNELIVSTALGNSFIYDVERKEYKEVKGYATNTKITQLKSFGEDRRFITAGDDNTLKVWDSDVGKSFFFRSEEDNPSRVTDRFFTLDNEAHKWMLKTFPGDTIFFRNDNVKPRKDYNYAGFTTEVEWDTSQAKNGFIKIMSPVSEYNDMYFYESADIWQDSLLLSTVKISDMAGGGSDNKMKNRLNIKSVIISDCRRFVMIKCTDRTARYFYYCIYPTFEGLYDMVENKKLLKTRL